MSSIQQRKEEILAKKAKLAELKKQRELRQKEFTSNRASLDASEACVVLRVYCMEHGLIYCTARSSLTAAREQCQTRRHRIAHLVAGRPAVVSIHARHSVWEETHQL